MPSCALKYDLLPESYHLRGRWFVSSSYLIYIQAILASVEWHATNLIVHTASFIMVRFKTKRENWRSNTHLALRSSSDSITLTSTCDFEILNPPYFIQDEYRRIHSRAHCYVTDDAIVMIIIVFESISYGVLIWHNLLCVLRLYNEIPAIVKFHNYTICASNMVSSRPLFETDGEVKSWLTYIDDSVQVQVSPVR